RGGNIALSNAFHRGLFTVGFVYGEKPAATGRSRSAPRPSRPEPRLRDAATSSRLVPGVEYAPQMFAPEKNSAWLEFQRTKFAVPMGEPLAAFARLAGHTQACTIEASCKVEHGTVHAGRFNLFYHGSYGDHFLNQVFGFFDAVESRHARLNRRSIEHCLSGGIDLSGVRKVVTGLDVREGRERSRLKLWFILNDAPELARRAIALHGETRQTRALRLHEELLIGFDLRFDGTEAVKIYPDVRPAELDAPERREKLAEALSPASLDAMAQCSWTHIYLAKHNSDI